MQRELNFKDSYNLPGYGPSTIYAIGFGNTDKDEWITIDTPRGRYQIDTGIFLDMLAEQDAIKLKAEGFYPTSNKKLQVSRQCGPFNRVIWSSVEEYLRDESARYVEHKIVDVDTFVALKKLWRTSGDTLKYVPLPRDSGFELGGVVKTAELSAEQKLNFIAAQLARIKPQFIPPRTGTPEIDFAGCTTREQAEALVESFRARHPLYTVTCEWTPPDAFNFSGTMSGTMSGKADAPNNLPRSKPPTPVHDGAPHTTIYRDYLERRRVHAGGVDQLASERLLGKALRKYQHDTREARIAKAEDVFACYFGAKISESFRNQIRAALTAAEI